MADRFTEERIEAPRGDDERAEQDRAPLQDRKPRLLVEKANPDQTVASLRDLLVGAGGLYERGGPARVIVDQMRGESVAQQMTPYLLMLKTHQVSRPYIIDRWGKEVDAPLPLTFARMYLDWRGEWHLPPLRGIATAPLLQDDGTIRCITGYDDASGMWCENIPDITRLVPEQPTKKDAEAAFLVLRGTIKTFCFADAETINDPSTGLRVVDLTKTPGQDESGLLIGLLTAVCRPSLPLAPGLLLTAAPISGAGTGKGLLGRCICAIAYGRKPHAVTSGATTEELEKRIAAELMRGSPSLFLDNLNNTAFKSDLLASAITENPARVRVLGKSKMVTLNAYAFVILTGNGLTVSEDLARRFIAVAFDAHMEDPESRPFTNDILAEVTARRAELLAAVLTIWRWGRLASELEPGLPLGSFEQWCLWVRDPLLALGCQDPVARVGEAKQRDRGRQDIAALFAMWWKRHGDAPVAVRDIHPDVAEALDPQNRGRQYLAARLEKLVGTRLAGFVLTRQAPVGKWGVATYALKKTGPDHRGDGGHGPDAPDAPHADCAPNADEPRAHWRGRI